MRCARATIVVGLAFAICGCVALTPREQRRLDEMKSFGMDPEEIKVKNPKTAAWLNVGPGLGNLYLSWGTWEYTGPDMLIAAVSNLASWPLSPVWSIREGQTDAMQLNVKATLDYYYHTSEGLRVIEAREAAKQAMDKAKRAKAAKSSGG